MRAHAAAQHLERERLKHVIVGAGSEPVELVDVLHARRKEMIGQLRCSRIRRQSLNPSMPGMFTSSKARSIPACSSVKLRLTA